MNGHFDLSPDDWATLRQLLQTALDVQPRARETWLEGLGAEHAAFKSRLRALLLHAGDTQAAQLDTLPKIETAQFLAARHASVELHAGDRVGTYQLIRLIGEGGMGSVWLAERTDMLHRRQVALKLPHASWHGAALAERLAREREILASLNHPNIARLYDAGVAGDGQPYLALEYVAGERIDAYCDRRKLDVRARLRLFLQIARAVAHAHANLVVHRDLKPANILVTEAGDVRLLDFGIAKLLEQDVAGETALTQFAGRALTPDYAAPEQILGHPIGTGADIYALGVVLFELLTGARPYRLKRDSPAALEEAILQAEPARPSATVSDPKLRRTLRGDLDTIVSKALKKAPPERYATVDALADDIERHLDSRPVLAQADSAWYRGVKFVTRNRMAVAAVGAVASAVLIGAAAALWQMGEAQLERDAALRQQQRAEAFSEFLYVLLEDAGPAGRPFTIPELLDRGVVILDRQEGLDASLAAYMQYEISRRYLTLNQTQRMQSLLDRSATVARASGDASLLAATQCSAAWSLADNDLALAQTRLDEGERALAQAARAPVFTVAECLGARARVLHRRGDDEAAIAALRKGLALLDGNPVQAGSRRRILVVQLADLYRATDRFKEALALSGQELQLVRQAGRTDSLAEFAALNNHAGNLARMGEVAQSAALLEQAYAWMVQRQSPTAQPVGFRANYGLSLLRLGQPLRALEMADEELRLAADAGSARASAIAQLLAARALLELGRFDDAERRLDAAETVARSDPKAFARLLQEMAVVRALVLIETNRVPQARRALDTTLQRLGYPERDNAPGLDRALRAAATLSLREQDAAAAERYAGAALAVSKRIAHDEQQSADVGAAALLRAQALAAQGRNEPAGADAALAAQALHYGLGAQHAATVQATELLAQLRKP